MEDTATRNDLAKRFTGTGAEIGVYRGEFSEVIGRYATKLYCVDPYKGYSNHDQSDLDLAQQAARKLLPNADFIIMGSVEAARLFDRDSLDFVYIDGRHDFMNIAQDISAWTRKVKKGGIVAGHDYFVSKWTHVRPVVDAYAASYGKKIHTTSEVKYPSWWFVK